ncbi:MAG: hypothetical protein ACTMIY_03105 [Microbacterium gubbeenense]
MALTGLAAEVTKSSIAILLLKRDPGVLDRTFGAGEEPLFDAHVRQVATEVIAVTGPDPKGTTRELALQCIAYGVGSAIEYAEFPEQQMAGDQGRGWFLKKRFGELLDMLKGMPSGGGTSGGTSRGRFPPPRRFPDPIRGGAY